MSPTLFEEAPRVQHQLDPQRNTFDTPDGNSEYKFPPMQRSGDDSGQKV